MLMRLLSAFGTPFGMDGKQKLVSAEWHRAIGVRSKRAVMLATDRWIATEKRFPTPAQIIQLADAIFVPPADPLQPNSARSKSFDFPFQSSELRRNRNWAMFLENQHPTVEHNYFVGAEMREFEHVIVLRTEFQADWVRRNLSEKLERHFGRRVAVMAKGGKDA